MAALLLWVGSAQADRKRVVVLELEGPKAEKFHSDIVKLLKKSHTVLSVDKWNGTAEELNADRITKKSIAKVAKKLKVDGVVTGKIEKRRDEYIIRLKLRAGTTGEVLGSSITTKSEDPRLDAQAQRDLKDELVAAIDELESNRKGGGDDEEEEEEEAEEEEEPKKSGFSRKSDEDDKKSKKKKAEEEAEAKRLAAEDEKRKKDEEKRKKDEEAKKKKADEEAAVLAARKAKDNKAKAKAKDEEEDEEEEEEEEEDEPKKSRKKTASRDDEEEEDEEGIEEDVEVDSGGARDLSPANRALDAVVGMSFTARRLSFSYASDLAKPPPGYKQTIPVAGAIIDLTLYPMSFSKSSKGITRGIGINVLYDQVLMINSQKKYADGAGMQQIADLKTQESRWAVGPVLRYPMGKIVVGGSLTYGKQKFLVAQALPNGDKTDIPNVEYTMITPAAFITYPVLPKVNLNASAAFHGVTNTGAIQQSGMDGYGAATVTAFEIDGGGDYMITKNIFARATVRYETFNIKFKGDPTSMTHVRDTDMDQDVTAAKDVYFGGSITVGYVY